jgi:hypothetical protein
MVDEKQNLSPLEQEREKLKDKVDKKEQGDLQQIIKQIATREKLERDYKEDLLNVEFYSSPETRRCVKARRPTQEEMISIMRLSTEAAIYEGKMDSKSIQRMLDVYDQLPIIAAKLSVDTQLNADFWKTKISFFSLQSFITELIKANQATPVSEAEMKSFR